RPTANNPPPLPLVGEVAVSAAGEGERKPTMKYQATHNRHVNHQPAQLCAGRSHPQTIENLMYLTSPTHPTTTCAPKGQPKVAQGNALGNQPKSTLSTESAPQNVCHQKSPLPN